MKKETQYAHALRALLKEHPADGKKYLTKLREVLARHGHEKLLPRIVRAYEALLEKEERFARYDTISPAEARTRTLVELYRTLIATK
jgi:F0F1-type ATP synthase delta subunit